MNLNTYNDMLDLSFAELERMSRDIRHPGCGDALNTLAQWRADNDYHSEDR